MAAAADKTFLPKYRLSRRSCTHTHSRTHCLVLCHVCGRSHRTTFVRTQARHNAGARIKAPCCLPPLARRWRPRYVTCAILEAPVTRTVLGHHTTHHRQHTRCLVLCHVCGRSHRTTFVRTQARHNAGARIKAPCCLPPLARRWRPRYVTCAILEAPVTRTVLGHHTTHHRQTHTFSLQPPFGTAPPLTAHCNRSPCPPPPAAAAGRR